MAFPLTRRAMAVVVLLGAWLLPAAARAADAADPTVDAARHKIEAAEQRLGALLTAAENSAAPQALDDEARPLDQELRSAAAAIKELPADDSRAKALSARLEKISAAFSAAVAGRAAEVYRKLKQSADGEAEDVKGWDEERVGPTWAQYVESATEEIKAMNAPKTVAVLAGGDRWLRENFALGYAPPAPDAGGEDGRYQAYLIDPKIKALADQAAKDRDAAAGRLAKFAGDLLAQAEKALLDDAARGRLRTLAEEDLPADLGAAPQLKPLQDRARALAARQ